MPNPRSTPYSRRTALRSIGVAATGTLSPSGLIAGGTHAPSRDVVGFFFVTDTHYLAQKHSPSEMDATSAAKCGRLVETLNALQGSEIPAHAGGGSIDSVNGVIHGGDLVDSADKRGGPYPEMYATEFAAFEKDYGLTGRDGRLRYPVYEVYGNHDGPQGDTSVIDGIKRRNKSRVGVTHVSANGLHYSWDWGHVHFVNLGIVVGESDPARQRRRYAPLESLAFLRSDLEQLKDEKQPVVITQHIDIARNAVPCEPEDEKFVHMEWHPQDVHSFYEAIRPFHVIADFHGHTHAGSVFGWEGTPEKKSFDTTEIDVFNGDNGSHFRSEQQAFYYVEIQPLKMIVREVRTEDAWKTQEWSRIFWTKAI